MAGEEISSLVVKVGIDDSLFSKGVKEIDKTMGLLKTEFSATSSKLKEFGSDTDKLGNKAQFLGKAMQLQEQKVKELAKAFEKSKQETGENSTATQELAIKLNRAISQYNKFEGELKQTEKALSEASKEVKEQGSAWDTLKNKIANATSGMGENIKRGIGMAIGGDIWDKAKAGFISVTTFGSDLSKTMNNIQASTGYATNAMSSIKDVLIGIYNDNFGESFEDIGNAVKTIGQQSGASGNELKNLAEDALMLRDTFGFEVNESFRSAKMLMDQFGMSGEEAYNLIAQGAQWGLDKNGDLLDTINEYSVQFKQLGFNSDEMFNMLANGAMSGTFSVDKLGDAVKEFGIRAKDGSSSTQQAFKQLGLDANKTSMEFAKGGETGKKAFEEVNKKLLEIKDPLKQNQIGTALWGTMWEDLGKEGIASLTSLDGEISKTNNALQDIKKVKYNDLGSAFEGIKRNMQTGLILPISNILLPKLSDFSNWFIANMPQIQSSVSGAMDKIIPVFEGFGKGIQLVIDNSNWLIPVLAGVVSSIGAFNIISTVKGLIDIWKASTFAMTLAQEGLNVALTANPIGLIIVGIGLLVAAGIALYKNWDFIKAKAIELKNAIGQKFTEIGVAIGNIWNSIKGFFISIGNGIAEAWNFIKNVVTVGIMLIGAILQGAFTIITIPFMFIWENCKVYIFSAWDFISNKVSSALSYISSIISNVFNAIKGFVAPIWDGIKNNIASVWNAISSNISSAINSVRNVVSSVFNSVKSTVSSIWEDIKNKVSSVWSSLVSVFTSIGGSIKSAVSSVFDGVKSSISDKIEGAKSIVNSGLNSIKSFFNGLVLKLPHIKLPHFSLNGSFSLDPPRVPSLDISWYAKGGIFSSPQVIGVGDAKSPEAVVPLDKLQGFIDNAIAKNVNGLGNSGVQTIIIPVNLNGKQIARVIAPDVNKELGNLNRKNLAWR